MEPLVSLTITNPSKDLPPSEPLRWEFQIDALQLTELQAVEASVLWYTEGKGEEELGVHFFQRDVRTDFNGDLRTLRQFETALPNSPISYEGTLLKIRWCIRVRVFIANGKTHVHDQAFRLGDFEVPHDSPMVLHSALTNAE